MDHDDPFGTTPDDAGDRTIIRPRPGGKGPQQPLKQPSQPAAVPRMDSTIQSPRQGSNLLESAASSLLNLLGRLHDTPSHPDPAALKSNIIEEFKAFEARAQNLGVERESIFWGRYALCTAIDEAVLSTPWGNSSIWRDQSLLVTLHNEAWGGEKFFQLLQKLLQNPARNLDLLELMYICLAFGFQGRYRPLPDGHTQLQTLRDNLYRTLRNQRGEYERELSIHWQGAALKQNPLVQYVPLWVVLAVSGVVLLLIYFGFTMSLNTQSDPVYTQLHDIARNVQTVVERKPLPPAPSIPAPPVTEPPPPPKITLLSLLADEVAQNKVSLDESLSQALIQVEGDGLFASGSVKVKEEILPLLQRIAEALNQIEGRIVVVGHTDSVPIRSLRFPSNWHLSRARSKAVADILEKQLADPKRLESEGRGSAEPLVPNDSPINRARNRRVEITLLKQ
ncbi:MAG: type VI secretion system protein TssL [Chromatiaceae bacterium]|nr:type VI secretion system protein TssL [Chromatiaceae bacterium]